MKRGARSKIGKGRVQCLSRFVAVKVICFDVGDDRNQWIELQEGPVDYWKWRVRYNSFLTMKDRFGFSETEVVNA